MAELLANDFGENGKNDHGVSEIFIYKDGYPQPSVPFMDDPLLIDFSLLNSSSPEANDEMDKFKAALSSWGCFQLINHGIPSSFLEEMAQVGRQFFGLPMEKKHEYKMLPGGTNGYDGTTTRTSNNHVVDWNEGLSLTVYPEDRRVLEFWPESPPRFKTILHEYSTRLAPIFNSLFQTIVRSLNIDEEKFNKRYGLNQEINARFNFYPQCPSPENVLGLKAHADFSAVTILLQDEVGLQVEKDGQWFMAPIIPGALFVNLGDPTEIMTNGVYKSAVHRVVTNSEKARLSLALFWDSDRNGDIGPLEELVTKERPQLYKNVSLKDYISTFYHHYQSGDRHINNVSI